MHLQWISTGFARSPGDVGLLVRATRADRAHTAGASTDDEHHGAGTTLLLDCGPSVPDSIIELGLLGEITDVVVTDIRHAGGLARLALTFFIQSRTRKRDKPTLHLAANTAGALWEAFYHADIGQMPARLGPGDGVRADLWRRIAEEHLREVPGGFGEPKVACLEDFFHTREFSPGRESIQLAELPELKLIRNLGGSNMRYPSYGGFFRGGGFYFSGNTGRLPPFLKPDISVFFQYCRLSDEEMPDRDVLSYELLKDRIPNKFRSKTYLVPIDGVFDEFDPQEDGFAGDVFPFQEYMFTGSFCHQLPFVIDSASRP